MRYIMIQLNINQNSYQAIIIKHENDLTVCEEHSHNFLELAYTVRGKAIHTLNGASSTISEGDYIITIPGDIHKYDKLGEENLEIINCIYTPDFSIDSKTLTPIDSILEDLNIDFDSLTHHPARYIFHDDSKTVLNILNIMENEYKNKNPKYKFILQKLFDAIFLYSLKV